MDNEEVLSHSQLKKLKERAKKVREERYQEQSRKRLDNIISKKIKTTFIGAIAAFEEEFGFLWGANKSERTEEEQEMYDLWQQARTRILNHGNAQLRGAQNEIANHQISWNRYTTFFQVKGNNNE
jgi:transcription termination factor Rho